MAGKFVVVGFVCLVLWGCAANSPQETTTLIVNKNQEEAVDMMVKQGMSCWARKENNYGGRIIRVVKISDNASSISVLNYTGRYGLGGNVFSMNVSRQGERSLLDLKEEMHDCSMIKGCQTDTYTADTKRWVAGDLTCSTIDWPMI